MGIKVTALGGAFDVGSFGWTLGKGFDVTLERGNL